MKVYPRLCGGTAYSASADLARHGLSPPVRGNPRRFPAARQPLRSIPACAGEPGPAQELDHRAAVYPRLCGGTDLLAIAGHDPQGLSPPVRGNRPCLTDIAVEARSIPACAGEPGNPMSIPPAYSVYPRLCGGTNPRNRTPDTTLGLSPPVRGNLFPDATAPPHIRSIPACAGEPAPRQTPALSAPVYPRLCGGTSITVAGFCHRPGLSPPVRGNRLLHRFLRPYRGSIPACAGEPVCRRMRNGARAVYPRLCGGTSMRFIRFRRHYGLSPPVRGNRIRFIGGNRAAGSIPACAGGTETARQPADVAWGLSPPVRGNRRVPGHLAVFPRSIPACAGEPNFDHHLVGNPEVYPRLCGGTPGQPGNRQHISGLSPPVRGNLSDDRRLYRKVGSIPACAGEPGWLHHQQLPAGVYPRLCGGTPRLTRMVGLSHGLSPPVRGNLWAKMPGVGFYRSIPACAGEPS